MTYIANVPRFPSERAHGIQIAKMCEAFIEAGVDLTLVIPHQRHGPSAKEFYGLRVGIPVHELPFPIFPRLGRMGFVISSIVFGIVAVFFLLRNKFSGVVYSVDLDYRSFFLMPLIRNRYFFEMHSPKQNTFAHRRLFSNIAGIIAINEPVRRELEKTFPELQGKSIVLPNGVDVSLFGTMSQEEARQALHIDEKELVVVYTGSFQHWKGIEALVAALRMRPHLVGYLVGGTREELEALGVEFSANIKVIGKQRPFQDISRWLAAADVLVVTGTTKDAYSNQFTSPMKLFEYLAAQKPIVAARTKAIEQLVTEEEVFWYVPDDPESLSAALDVVFADRGRATTRALAAKKKAEQYSWERRAHRILDFLGSRT